MKNLVYVAKSEPVEPFEALSPVAKSEPFSIYSHVWVQKRTCYQSILSVFSSLRFALKRSKESKSTSRHFWHKKQGGKKWKRQC
jgi:hypothetical protein